MYTCETKLFAAIASVPNQVYPENFREHEAPVPPIANVSSFQPIAQPAPSANGTHANADVDVEAAEEKQWNF